MAAGRPHEFELIKRYFAPLASDPGSVGLTDDAAVLTPAEGRDLVLTKDMLAADVHFFADDPPEAIAAKALRVNLSDLAAKGARPRGYMLGLALPKDWSEDWLDRFCRGLGADQAAYDVVLLGGDTIKSNNGLQISITAIGDVARGRAVRRSGARPGDRLYLSGTVGDAAAGLQCRLDPSFAGRAGLTDAEIGHLQQRYLLPQPRTGLAAAIERHAGAALDVSDGLIADASHMASASGVDLELELSTLPLSPALARLRDRDRGSFLACLNGGDDYEILTSVAEADCGDFEAAARTGGNSITRIGVALPGTGKVRLLETGDPVVFPEGGGFRHF